MKNRTIISVRSNCDFGLNYETSNLHPQTEIILITTSPQYTINSKGDALKKSIGVDEFRFKTDLDGLNKLIGELQIAVNNINHFNQLAGSLNTIIESHKKPKEDIK